ncbi:ejaculatory bulb-specific protein 3-like [Chironomus tepperi]|uniref:ejaculatory bulb-specific protein 3-like n=1 Tax=Chironomus tepperi TaxID=113505 RepID=UPI00391F836F
MKIVLILCIVSLTLVNAQLSRLANFDINTLLKNDRILNNYMKCLLDKGPCTNDGRDLKKHLPEALQTTCGQCSLKQKKDTKKLINHLETKKPQIFGEVRAKYDPSGERIRAFKSLQV